MSPQIDWDGARRRLAAVQAALAAGAMTDAQRDAVFERRAERLAAPLTGDALAERFEVLVLALGPERYALPSSQVREVRTAGEITPLPGAPGFVAGLINVRGRIVPVLDLRPVFGIPAGEEGSATVVILAGREGDVGMLSTEQPAMRWLLPEELGELPAGAPAGLNPAWVRGVTPDVVVVLDAGRLLEDARLVVREER